MAIEPLPSFLSGQRPSARAEAALPLLNHPLVNEAFDNQRRWAEVRPMARAAGFDPELAWFAVKWQRLVASSEVPIAGTSGLNFRWCRLAKLEQTLQAVDRMRQRFDQEERRHRLALQIVQSDRGINLRQRLLLEHALRHPRTGYLVEAHARSHGITKGTARADLLGLVDARYFIRSGKNPVTYLLSPAGLAKLKKAAQR